MKPINISSKSVRQTAFMAKNLAAEVLETRLSKNAVVIGLQGDLGAGKTTFVKAFIRGLGVRKKVISPTFIVMRNFPIRGLRTRVYHIDAYRLGSKALGKLGLRSIVGDPNNIVVIEWADRVKNILPRDAVVVDIKHGIKHNERHFAFNRR
ncbi:MAG: tRNA (adenosine(37)-N6)-threonylcarbamoyltransferase complex ATPase subunit type 1 TsaE [Patescibacteria group bacterium]|nr:tRNA (adenosine(37)-N6)-threonylcarbamoyltransferase complex ATPase subunit type 1 TsaE [Patescibacteria group bacterium]MCL5224111.1 tRNA (adenosine(37)-N6)-threonylcarbamoyltransferase complex ATPase subunit type 1 TsaE [Patescibacteria group bacterium]